jgi:hypothetical protein
MEKSLEKGRFLVGFFFHKILASHGKVPRKGPIFSRIFLSKFWPHMGKYLEKGRFFQKKIPHTFPLFFGKFIFQVKKAEIREVFLKMTGKDK